MLPLENGFLSAIFLSAKQITLLFKASDNVPLSWGKKPSAYHLPASHSIRPPFNYRAGHKPVFPHHAPSTLRPSFNDEKSPPGGLGICFNIILLPFYFQGFFFSFCCVFVHARGCLCTHPAHLSFFFSHILLSGLKFDVLRCAAFLFHTFGYSFTRIQCDFTLSLTSLLLRLDQ